MTPEPSSRSTVNRGPVTIKSRFASYGDSWPRSGARASTRSEAQLVTRLPWLTVAS